MKILVTSSFYAEYELYETSDPEGLKDNIKRLAQGEDIDTSKYMLIGSQDNMITEDAINQADEIIYIEEYI